MSDKKAKLAELNAIRAERNLKPLSSWKRSNADLDFTIKTLKAGAVLKEEAPAPKAETAKKADAPKSTKAPRASKEGISYASIIKPLLSTDMTNKEIWAQVLAQKPDADKAKHWYPAWYRSHIARKGAK